jgi:hypothetical protein
MEQVTLYNPTDGQSTAVINGQVSHIGPKGRVTVEKDLVDLGKVGPGIVVYPVPPITPPIQK